MRNSEAICKHFVPLKYIVCNRNQYYSACITKATLHYTLLYSVSYFCDFRVSISNAFEMPQILTHVERKSSIKLH